MSDQELRKGIRILVSGGASSLGDETLEKVVISCQQTQRERNPAALTMTDATYLQEYLTLCENLLNRHLKEDEANEELKDLNERYKDADLGPNIKKSHVAGDHLCTPSGWVPSEVCW